MEGHGEEQGVRDFEAAGSSPNARETTAEVSLGTLRRSKTNRPVGDANMDLLNALGFFNLLRPMSADIHDDLQSYGYGSG